MPIPEKDFYTLDEIAECWACIGITKSSFLDLAKKDLLVFSFYEKDIGSHREISDVGKVKNVEVLKFIALGFEHSAIRYLRSDDSRRVLEADPNQEVKVTGSYSQPERTKESGLGKIMFLRKSDLGVSLLEKRRFESEHEYKSIKAVIYRNWLWIKNSENRNSLGWVLAKIGVMIWGIYSIINLII